MSTVDILFQRNRSSCSFKLHG